MPIRLPFLIALTVSATAPAAQLPAPSPNDPRIRYVTYSKDDVTTIRVQRGTATRIILGDDEKILPDASATGFAADCSKPEFEWCIRTDPGTNHILVKPKDGATHNNLELKTDKRDYSFAFRVLPNATATSADSGLKGNGAPMYRVVFLYRPALSLSPRNSESSPEAKATSLDRQDALSPPSPRNWRYSMQVLKNAQDIAPSLVFDDGRFTYFRFPANREIPTVFHVAPDGQEARVNTHMDDTDDALLVVERMGRQFVLRLGSAAVGVWNDAFDPEGLAPLNGTTIRGVERAIRSEALP